MPRRTTNNVDKGWGLSPWAACYHGVVSRPLPHLLVQGAAARPPCCCNTH